MSHISDFPFLIFVISFIAMLLAAKLGDALRKRLRPLEEKERQDLNIVLGATLTLLGLIIGFSFSMVITRYDQRKNYEAEEANAIGTEYVRADMLPAEDAAKLRDLLKSYLHERVLYYETADKRELKSIASETAQLQGALWSIVQAAAARQPTPPMALVVSGMNDVLNFQGYTQAAWWNRLPVPAWVFLGLIAVFCNVLLGYVSHRSSTVLFLVLPLAVSISFLLIADIDSPRSGLIRVIPQNLVALSQSLPAQ